MDVTSNNSPSSNRIAGPVPSAPPQQAPAAPGGMPPSVPPAVGEALKASEKFEQGLGGVGGREPVPFDRSEMVAEHFKNPEDFERLNQLLEERPFLQLSDLIAHDKKGKLVVDPSLFDDEVQDILSLGNYTPDQVLEMKKGIFEQLPADFAALAMPVAADLLAERPDLQPQDMVKLLQDTRMAASKDGVTPGGDPMYILEIFKDAGKLMSVREDISPGEVGNFLKKLGKMGRDANGDGGKLLSDSFKAASQAMIKNPKVGIGDMVEMTEIVERKMPGKGEENGKNRYKLFIQAANMMGKYENLRPKHIEMALDGARKNGAGGKGLIGALVGMEMSMDTGRVNLTQMLKGESSFDADGRQVDKPKPKAGQEGQTSGKKAPGPGAGADLLQSVVAPQNRQGGEGKSKGA